RSAEVTLMPEISSTSPASKSAVLWTTTRSDLRRRLRGSITWVSAGRTMLSSRLSAAAVVCETAPSGADQSVAAMHRMRNVGVAEPARDLLVGEPVGEEGQHLALARCERGWDRVVVGLLERRRDARRDGRGPGRRGPDAVDELGRLRVLQQVARRAGVERAGD